MHHYRNLSTNWDWTAEKLLEWWCKDTQHAKLQQEDRLQSVLLQSSSVLLGTHGAGEMAAQRSLIPASGMAPPVVRACGFVAWTAVAVPCPRTPRASTGTNVMQLVVHVTAAMRHTTAPMLRTVNHRAVQHRRAAFSRAGEQKAACTHTGTASGYAEALWNGLCRLCQCTPQRCDQTQKVQQQRHRLPST